jgi:hypothetical protein
MKYLFATFILLSFSTISNSQFSSRWPGNYSGDLFTQNVNGTETAYHMELIIEKQSETAYSWIIVYGEDSTRQERKYQLNILQGSVFQLDEKNGIVLNISHNDNELTSVFEVGGSLLHVIYRLDKKGIYFELTSSGEKNITGGQTNYSDGDIPEITTYRTTAFQTAYLKKI